MTYSVGVDWGECAASYAAAGLNVFPLVADGKRPALSLAQSSTIYGRQIPQGSGGHKLATSDAASIDMLERWRVYLVKLGRSALCRPMASSSLTLMLRMGGW